MDRVLWPLMALVVFVLVLALAFAGVVAHDSQARARDRADLVMQNCLAIEHLKSYAYATAIRSLKTLPTIAYYKQHPDELQAALGQVREQRAFFAPKPCAS